MSSVKAVTNSINRNSIRGARVFLILSLALTNFFENFARVFSFRLCPLHSSSPLCQLLSHQLVLVDRHICVLISFFPPFIIHLYRVFPPSSPHILCIFMVFFYLFSFSALSHRLPPFILLSFSCFPPSSIRILHFCGTILSFVFPPFAVVFDFPFIRPHQNEGFFTSRRHHTIFLLFFELSICIVSILEMSH